jgi:arginyl-tRNA--protein-N-Asp/Glu arginylyltransferase
LKLNNKTTNIPFIFREDYTCPYFDDGRVATSEYLIPEKHGAGFHKLLAKGYRRLGQIFYRNVCRGCSACEPLRIEVGKFAVSASQKRTLRRNEDIHIAIRPSSSLTPGKVELYEKYIISKHSNDKKKRSHDPLPVLFAIHSGYDHIIEMTYYHGEKLIGVGIVDEAADSLSSNYFYYDTDYLVRRPGVLSILMEISLAKKMGKKHYYLGFYIEGNNKMAYKKYFRPNQIYRNNRWQEFLKG